MKNYAPWRIWSEHDASDGGAVNFITAGGVFLQSLVFGYGGVRFHDKGMRFDPMLPPGCRSMKLRGLNYADAEFDILVDGPGSAHFSRRKGSGSSGGNVLLHREASGQGAYWLQQRATGKAVSKTDDDYSAQQRRSGGPRPCDILTTAGSPCVAAHSSTRALYAAYAGPLYALQQGSRTMDIKVTQAGGVVDAAAHEAFCGPAGACTVVRLYDQSPQGNHLGIQHGTPNLESPRNGSDRGVGHPLTH